MNATELRRHLASAVLPRAREVLHGTDAGNGTPLADAAATIIAGEIAAMSPTVAAKDPQAAIAAMSDATLTEIARTTRDLLLRHHGAEVVLPSGAKLKSLRQGAIKYGGQEYMLSRDVPGIHLKRDMPAAKACIDLFRRDLADAVNAVRAADTPAIAPTDIHVAPFGFWSTDLEIPHRVGPGTTAMLSQRVNRIDGMTDEQRTTAIDRQRDHAIDLARDAERNDAYLRPLVDMAATMMDQARTDGLDVAFVQGVVTHSHHRYALPGVELRFRVLGSDFRHETWKIHISQFSPTTAEDVRRSILTQLTTQRRRAKRLAEAKATGTTGRIDTITLAVLRTSAEPIEEILARVATKRRTTAQTPDHGRVGLNWKDGVVHSSFHIKPGVTWSQGRITLSNTQLPAAVVQSLKGRPITELVQQRFMDEAATIRSISSTHGWLRVNLAIASVAFDAASGRIEE